jgi:glycosyltransferase 2 family protein
VRSLAISDSKHRTVVPPVTTEGPAAPQPTPSARRKRLSLLIRVVVLAVALAALTLCVIAVVKEWRTLSSSLAHANWPLLLAGFVLAFAGMVSLALLWRSLLAEFGAPTSVKDSIRWYFAGELGKYIPGGLWPVVGRGELARRAGVRRSVAYTSVLLSLGLMCVGAAIVCGLLAPFVTLGAGAGWGWLLLVLIPLGVFGVHPMVLGRVFGLMSRLTKGRFEMTAVSWPRMLRFIVIAIPAWIFVGASALCVAASLHLSFSAVAVALAAVAGWIIGFLAIPVPAGAGVREVVFIAVSGLVSTQAVVLATVFRLVFLVVDLAGGAYGLASLRSKRGLSATTTAPESS